MSKDPEPKVMIVNTGNKAKLEIGQQLQSLEMVQIWFVSGQHWLRNIPELVQK